ncbi:MAG: hypothetical protein HRU11_10510 [Parvularculaceae bacterium]|nr:hypothetical protein [Parvularculaceae bacterium]
MADLAKLAFANATAFTASMQFTGLSGRYLARNDFDYGFAPVGPAKSQSASSIISGELALFPGNLAEYTQQLLAPIYRQFDFTPVSTEFVRSVHKRHLELP